MKVTVLTENTACSADYQCEHGLSLYIEHGREKILFDSGQSDVFEYNARRLGIDLSGVDYAVLSHGHYDHGGGIARFLELNSRAKVYVSEHAFEPYYNGQDKYIGIDPALSDNRRLSMVSEALTLSDGAELIPWGDHICRYPNNSFGLNAIRGDCFVPDVFRHEQYLLITCNGKRVLFSGCSHKGILNIMDRFKPDVLVGGFHFMKLSVDNEHSDILVDLARRLSEYSTIYYTCHCTGTEQYEFLSHFMGDRLRYISAGMSIEL